MRPWMDATSRCIEAQDARRYDASGNMTGELDGKTGKEKTIAYNSDNRIYEVRDGQTNQVKGQYWYDDQGFRIRKKAQLSRGGEYQDVDTLYPSKYFGMEIGDEFNAVNNIYLNGVRIAATTPNGAGVHYLTACARKRTSDTRPWRAASLRCIGGHDGRRYGPGRFGVLDDNANTVTRFEYMPYGETFVQKGDKDNAPKYNSQELDQETSWYFMNARSYDPAVMRFITADSVVDGEHDTQGWNRYSYVKGNPVRYKDPTGHLVFSTEREIPTVQGDNGAVVKETQSVHEPFLKK